MKRIVLGVAVMATLLSGPAIWAAAADEPAALPGTFNIPFKHELLNVHPRLLFSKDDMARWAKEGQDDEKFIWAAGASDFKNWRAEAVPTTGDPWNFGSEWQRLGWWHGTGVDLLYAKTGDMADAHHAIDLMMAMCKSEHWEVSDETDYGMGTGHLMSTVALIYDTTYDLLTEQQRQIVRHRLWLAADRMYNYGFNEFKKIPNATVRYWQQDSQNNHRWHRVCGYMMACLAIYGEEPGIDGYLDDAIKQTQFITQWLPEDGSNHEGVGYQAFGMQFLVPACVAMDRCLGIDTIRTHPCFHEVPYFRAHMITPDGQHMWNFGDGNWGTYSFNHYNFELAWQWHDPMAQALMLRDFQLSPESSFSQAFTLLWYHPSLKPGDLELLPTWRYFPDLDIAAFRQSWTDTNALATFFKCGNYGGRLMNEYRDSFQPPHYLNVAHDYPDANEFLFTWRGHVFATNTGGKQTSEHNTILVNGKGQDGEQEGGYLQPIENMSKRARIEQCFGAPGFGMVRGEAGGYYPALSKFSRTLLYVDNAYLVVADDVQARQPAAIDWLYHGEGQWTAAGKLSWLIAQGQDKVRLTLAAAPAELTAKLAAGSQDRRGGGTSLLTASYKGDRLRLVAVMAPQSAAPAEIVSCQETPKGFVLKIKRGDLVDLVAIGPTADAQGEIQSDAEAAVVTLRDGKAVKAMIVAGTTLTAGSAKLHFSQSSSILADATSGKLWVSAPLGAKAGPVSCAPVGMDVKSVNGQPVPAGAVEFPVTAMDWKELQDKLLNY